MSENEKMEQAGQELETAAPSKPAKADKKAKTDKKDSKPGVFQRLRRWFRELKSELKKVVWPSPQQTLKNTLVVIVCVIIVGIFIWVFDALATAVINALLHIAGKG